MNINRYIDEFPRKENVERRLDYITGIYCPLFGKSRTYGGEVLRAMNKILYEWIEKHKRIRNDEKLKNCKIILSDFAKRFGINFVSCKSDSDEFNDFDYEYILYTDFEIFLNTIYNHIELFRECSDFDID